jgi:hypothetical protein
MRTISLISLILAFILQFIAIGLWAQCKGFAKQVDLSLLDEYNYCGNVMTAEMYSEDSAEVDIKLEPRRKYRILIEAQEYLGQARLEVLDKSEEVISLKLETEGNSYWEIFSESRQKVLLKIDFVARLQSNHGINAVGCVLLAVGNIELEELVEKPLGKSADL